MEKPKQSIDLDRMSADLGTFARLVGAEIDEGVVARTLGAFEIGFRHQPVELRTTTVKSGKKRPDASFRYIDSRGTHDPFRIAVDTGALVPADRPVDRLVPELQEKFPIFGYGVDATAAYGLEKIWPFLDRPRPLEEASRLTSLPPSVARSEPWLRRHGLTHFCVIAADFRNASVNLYFLLDRASHGPDQASHILSDLGAPPPSPDALAHAASAPIVAVTYSYRRDTVERACLYVPEMDAGRIPSAGDPVLRAAIEQTPTLADRRMFVVGHSVGPGGAYTKLEIDYTGTSVPLFQKWIDRHAPPPGDSPPGS
ncbi:MAG: aromatic prenyltransferase [Polyangiaceae bacterium]